MARPVLLGANGSSNPMGALDLNVTPKADAIAPDGSVLTRAQALTRLVYAAFPLVDLDPDKAPNASAVLLNKEFGGTTCSRLYRYRVT